MKKLILLVATFLLVSCIIHANTHTKKTVHVFAFMGQSNMVGVPDDKYLTMQIDSRIKMLSIDDRIIQAKYDQYNDTSAYPDYIKSIGISSAVSFATIMLSYYESQDEIVIIPCARGASSMREQLEPNTKNIFGVVYPNSLLDTCISRINKVLSNVEFSRYDGTLYYQGETDAMFSEKSYEYWNTGILRIREAMQQNFGTSRFVFAQLARLVSSDEIKYRWNVFKNHQYLFSLESDIPMITTDDLDMFDGIHINADSQQIVGERFAKTYIDAFGNAK